jgi:choline dehydrogenase-like flavoprotein
VPFVVKGSAFWQQQFFLVAASSPRSELISRKNGSQNNMMFDLDRDACPMSADYIIVGAGAVGLVLAIALVRRGKSVVVAESGGSSFEATAQRLNDARVVGRPHKGISEGRARALGGTTNLWGGQLVAFDELDFAARPWMGAAAWPIDRQDLEPYYQAVAELLGLASVASDDRDVWRDLGLEPADLGTDFSVILTRWLREPAFANFFGDEIRQSSSLMVVLHATCTDFGFNPAHDRVEKVTLRSASGGSATVTADKVILAPGTIEASRLMLAVGQSHPSAPWSDNDWVGRGFQDHLDVRAAKVEIIDARRFADAFETISSKGFKYQPKISLTGEAQRRLQCTNIATSFEYDSSITEDLVKLKAAVKSLLRGAIPKDGGLSFKSLAATSKVWFPLMSRYIRHRRVFNIADRGTYLMLHCEQFPIKESQIGLARDARDAFGLPLAELDWCLDGREMHTMKAFCEHLAESLNRAGLANVVLDPDLAAADPAFLDKCMDTNHHCGGLRLSATPSEGVCDPQLRVHGMQNLYVAGAAVFPSSSFANPTFTAMALALRLVDHLSPAR